MARPDRRLPDNAPGDWYVDGGCIDCGHCRVVAPEVYGEAGGYARVWRQPAAPAEVHAAGLGLVACPVGAIGTAARGGLREAAGGFPRRVLPDVHHLGYAAEASFGASAWLVVRPGGNVLVDVPRPVRPLLDRIETLGGVRWMFLTHRDDVGAHAVVAARFGATRILHRGDLTHDTAGVERIVEGVEPVDLAPDLRIVPTPGHTRGSMCLLFRDVLFTGDHLWGRTAEGWADGGPVVGLTASRGVAWYSWPEQVRSIGRLRDVAFAHVLPGHGRPWHGEGGVPGAIEALWARVAG